MNINFNDTQEININKRLLVEEDILYSFNPDLYQDSVEYKELFGASQELIEMSEINSFIEEWERSKQKIVDAINFHGIVEANEFDSLEDLANKIEQLPKNLETDDAIPHTFNGTQSWDLLNEMNNHQLAEYPYMYAVEIECAFEDIILQGADAYLLSDGSWYDENSETYEHHFEYNDYENNYIIYYFKEPDYWVRFNGFDQLNKIICFNGRPKFDLWDNTRYILELISFTSEKYNLNNGELRIYQTSGNYSIILNGIEEVIGNNNEINSEWCQYFLMPDLKRWESGRISARRLGCINLPNLEYLRPTATLFDNYTIGTKLIIPKITTLYQNWLMYAWHNIKELLLSHIKSIEGGNLIYNCNNVETVTLENLNKFTGGTFVQTCNKLKEINLPNLENWTGGNLIIDYNGFSTNDIKLNIPKINYVGGSLYSTCIYLEEIELDWIKNVTTNGRVINNCYRIKNLSLPNLLEFNGYGIIVNSSNYVSELTIDLPKLKSITTGYILRDSYLASSVNLYDEETEEEIIPKVTINAPNLIKILSGGFITGSNSGFVKKVELNTPKLNIFEGGTIINALNYIETLELPYLNEFRGGSIIRDSALLSSLELPNLISIVGFLTATIAYNCRSIRSITLPSLKYLNKSNATLFNRCWKLKEINFPELTDTTENPRILAEYINGKDKIVINLPKLYDTHNNWVGIFWNSASAYYEFDLDDPKPDNFVLDGNIEINLGNPDGGWIYLNCYSAAEKSYIKNLTIQPRFRSYLRIDSFTNLSQEVLEKIIDNLADNSDYPTLQLVIGSVNKAKLSEEYILKATEKNWTVS